MKKLLAAAFAVLIITGFLAGCATTSAKIVATRPIRACIGAEPESIDPAINQTTDGATYISHAFEGLMKTDKSGKTVPGIAESYQVSADGLTYTFHLRKDAKWSDGKAVTAHDFVYSLQRVANPATASAYAYQLYYIKNASQINSQYVGSDGKPGKVKIGSDGSPVRNSQGNCQPDSGGKYVSAKSDGSPVWLDDLGVKATDSHTLVITLTSPCTYFLQIAASPTLYPVRQDIVEKNPDKWTLSPDTYISDGPYIMKSWNHDSKIVFVKNPYYYDKKDIVSNEIDWMLMSDSNAVLAAYKSGKLDLAEDYPTDELAGLVKSGDAKINSLLAVYYYVFNCSKAPFNNPKVRQALTLAVDRSYLVKTVDKGGQTPAGAFVPFGVPDAADQTDFRKTGGSYLPTTTNKETLAKAKRLLAEAGYPNGKGFPITEIKFVTNEGNQKIAEFIQSEWKNNLGITVTLSNEEGSVYLSDKAAGNYGIACNGFSGDYNDPMTFLDLYTSQSGNNDAGYSNTEYDRLIEQAKVTSNQKQRMATLHKAEKILMSDLPVMPIYYYTDPDLISPNLQGEVHSIFGYKYLMWASVKQ